MAMLHSLLQDELTRRPSEFSVIESPTTTVKSSAEPCNSTKMGACGTVLEYGTPNSTLEVEVSAENTDMVASAQVRLCYAKPYIVDRPWRAASNVIGKDKQCAAIACNNMLFDGDAATCTYNVGNLQGDGVYYFRALLVGENGQFISASEVKDGVDYFQINSYNGRTTPIIIAVIVMSCVAWAILIFGLVRERLKKD